MEEKMKTIIEQAQEIVGKDANILSVIVDKDGYGLTGQVGDISEIAKILFVTMHKTEEPIGITIHKLFRLLVTNLLHNKTPLTADLISIFQQHIKENPDEQI